VAPGLGIGSAGEVGERFTLKSSENLLRITPPGYAAAGEAWRGSRRTAGSRREPKALLEGYLEVKSDAATAAEPGPLANTAVVP
jgi:hypothetical protein